MVRVLLYTDYLRYLEKIPIAELDEKQVDRFLNQSFIDSFESLRIVSPPEMRSFLNTVRTKYEVLALKALLRLKFSEIPTEKANLYIIPIGIFTSEVINTLLSKGSLKALIEAIPDEGYRTTLLNSWRDFERDKILLPLEIALDYHISHRILNGARRIMSPEDYASVKNYYGNYIDAVNIGIILKGKLLGVSIVDIQRMIVMEGRNIKKEMLLNAIRARNLEETIKNLMIEPFYSYIKEELPKFQSTKDIYFIEKALDRFIYNRAKITLASYPFQVNTALAYLDLKFYEIKNLKAIIIGHLEDLSAPIIRRYLIY
ncbi:MAG: V-type ATPase subunit, partial [Candidatus Odinarchaeia archaeon]